MQKIRIVIIDDHTLIRQTWAFILNSDDRFAVAGETGNAENGIELCQELRPDIVLLDINLPGMNGIEAAPLIRKYAPCTKIIGVSLHTQVAYARKLIQLGGSGYITKNSSRKEMILALLQVHSGKKYICEEMKNIISQDILLNKENQGIHSLSMREMQIVDRIKQGLSSKEMAAEMYISVKTVEVHRYNILRKLNLKNAAQLVAYAGRYQLSLN
jgi:two-component system invasion response regulator UvrY